METSLPPKGLTAGRATRAVLTDMGLLSRSAAGTTPDRHAIGLALTLAQHPRAAAFCRSMTTPEGFTQAREHAGSPSVDFAHVYTANWAGYAKTETENGTGINSVAGSWTQGRDESPNFSSSEEDTWVGLGGGADNESTWGLIQVGTSMSTGLGYQSWYEYLDNTCQTGRCLAHVTPTGNVGPGDSILAETWWASSTEACFYLSDDGHPNADIPTTCLDPGITYDHTSAEWINEYPYTAYYDNPGTIYWSGQFFSDPYSFGGAYRSPFTGSYQADIMTYTDKYTATSCGNNNGVLSYPADPGGDSSDGTSQIITCSVQGVDS